MRQIDLPVETKIGYGLYLGHRRCMVVNGGTIIGNNVNLAQFLNIGTEHNTPAIIGDEVYVGPGVCIVEDVRIGSKSSIGAGSVVVKDIPAGSTCVGVPAKVLNYNEPARYIKHRWEIPVKQA
ncbi:MAG: acetyltransferase [Bacteroides sp.]|nr:acetyltransferase [Bacteroides sp.]